MEHTILVAVNIEAPTRMEAHRTVHDMLEDAPWRKYIDAWWVAEDDRMDGSDNDSAVFITPGLQLDAGRFLRFAGMSAEHNRYGVNANDKSEDAARQRERIWRWEPEVPDDTVLDLLMRVAEDVSREEYPDPDDVERLRAMFNPTD